MKRTLPKTWAPLAVAVIASVFLCSTSGLPLHPSSSGARTAGFLYPAAAPQFQVSGVTWNGQNVSSAGSPSTAITIQHGQTALVKFSFVEPSASYISHATLQLTYLGIALTTSKASPQVTGGPPIAAVAEINWSFDPIYYALEGVFAISANLQNANGSNVWSETFYIFAKAPYLIESGAPLILVVLVVVELYLGVTAIRDARRQNKPPKPGPLTPFDGGPAPGAPSSTPTAAQGPPPPAGTGDGSGGGPS